MALRGPFLLTSHVSHLTAVIHLLATGGTIAMQRSSAAGGNVPALDAQQLVSAVGGLEDRTALRVEDWERLPGVHRGPVELWALRNRVAELVSAAGGLAGVVITHGTDTLEETAYLLARTLPPAVPVVVTGAMRTRSDPDWDGPGNLRAAIAVARAPASRHRGTLVVFAGRILDGRFATKVNSFAPDAVGSPHAPELGSVTDQVRYAGDSLPHRVIEPRDLSPRVAIVPLILGDDGMLIESARAHCDGLVLEGFGRGNIPPGALPALARWLEDGKPVVLASRCAAGEVGGEYAFAGGGGELLRMGVIPAGPRTPALARLELVLALAAGVPYGGGD
jgi:L-asparaginase